MATSNACDSGRSNLNLSNLLRGLWRVFWFLEKLVGFYKDRKKLTYLLLSHLEIDIICSEFPPLTNEENDSEGNNDLDVFNDDNFETGNLVPDNHSHVKVNLNFFRCWCWQEIAMQKKHGEKNHC